MNTSLEVEYWVVDDDGDLAPPDTLLDVSEHVEPEFVEPMLEIKTTPCATMAELREELRGRLGRVVDAAREEGKRLVPLSTPLFASPAEVSYREKEGTDLQRRIVGPAFDDARFCAGTHVHVEQSNVADQLNALTALDPAFALVNSASHYSGERLLECARPYLYRRCCYASCPDQGQLWSYVDGVDEWERRLETAYDRFRATALERGVDPDRFDAAFDPYDAVWTPVRLRERFPTVEWRSPDTALPSQVLTLASEVRSFVARADERGTVVDGDEFRRDEPTPGSPDARSRGDGGTYSYRDRSRSAAADPVRLPPFETVERITDRAMHRGLADPDVRRYLRTLGFDPARYDPLADLVTQSKISRRQARSYRLEAAARLEADLERSMLRA